MTLSRRTCLALACGFITTLSAGHALARANVVRVSLWDKGTMSMTGPGKGSMMGMAMGKSGPRGPMGSMGPMGISVSSRTLKAGEVTFKVTNASQAMAHEMVVSPIKDESTPLPYLDSANKVDEKAAGNLGEVEELPPGKKGALTLTLKPGRYILYCNLPGHYALGMWTLLTVK